jgi:hypothetical protein
MRRLLLAALLTLAPAAAVAQNSVCLSAIPDYLRITVEQDSWKILQPQDLTVRDLPVWKANHAGQCPGIASGNFYPKAQSSYIIALIRRDGERVEEQTLLLTLDKKNKTETSVIIAPAAVNAVAVVWKLPRGHWRGIDGTIASISHDSFVSEQIISTATQYYYDGKHLKSFPLSR